MNVAVRVLNQGMVLPRLFVLPAVLKKQFVVISLLTAILFSALSIIYVQDVNRRLVGQLETLQNTYQNSHMQWSQLLLEESAWSSQTRVEKIARNQLNMLMPTKSPVIVI